MDIFSFDSEHATNTPQNWVILRFDRSASSGLLNLFAQTLNISKLRCSKIKNWTSQPQDSSFRYLVDLQLDEHRGIDPYLFCDIDARNCAFKTISKVYLTCLITVNRAPRITWPNLSLMRHPAIFQVDERRGPDDVLGHVSNSQEYKFIIFQACQAPSVTSSMSLDNINTCVEHEGM